MANEEDRGAHEIHASGLESLMKADNSPMSLMEYVPRSQKPGSEPVFYVSVECFLRCNYSDSMSRAPGYFLSLLWMRPIPHYTHYFTGWI